MSDGSHKYKIELDRDIQVQRLARSKFKNEEEARLASIAEAVGLPESWGGWCVGIDYVDSKTYGMSGHRAVSDKTNDQTRGLCWRCAWYAAHRYVKDDQWEDKDQ